MSTCATSAAARRPRHPRHDRELYRYDLSGNGAYVAFETDDALAGAADANGVGGRVPPHARAAARPCSRPARRGPGRRRTPPRATRRSATTGAGSRSPRRPATSSPASSTAAPRPTCTRATSRAPLAYVVSSQSGAPLTGGNGSSDDPQIAGTPGAAPGTAYIAFNSNATDLAGGGVDASDAESVYRRRLSLVSSTLVSRADGVAGANADRRAHVGGISDSASARRVQLGGDQPRAGRRLLRLLPARRRRGHDRARLGRQPYAVNRRSPTTAGWSPG